MNVFVTQHWWLALAVWTASFSAARDTPYVSMAPDGALASRGAAPPISLAGAAYDERRSRLVVVGSTAEGDRTETWEREDAVWRRVAQSGPSPRDEPLLAFDRARNVIVLHGGTRRAEGTPLDDTWEWDGIVWRQRASGGPVLPMSGALTFDSKANHLLLFDGTFGGGESRNSGLWSWDGTRWSLLPLSGLRTPTSRGLSGFAFDEARQKLVLFGGFQMKNGRPSVLGDTWEWDGEWREIRSAGPSARDHVALVYDGKRRALLMHGGGSPETGLVGDTWQYDGSKWVVLTRDGPARARHRLVFDRATQEVMLYGGWAPGNVQSHDLWLLRGNEWHRAPEDP